MIYLICFVIASENSFVAPRVWSRVAGLSRKCENGGGKIDSVSESMKIPANYQEPLE